MKATLLKFIFAIYFFSFSNIVFSQEWIYVTENVSGDSKYYIQNTRINTYGNPKVWSKTIEKNITYSKNGKTYNVSNATLNELYEYDCNENRKRLIKTIIYDSSGKVLHTFDLDNYYKWNYTVPNSVGNAILKKVCELF